MKIVPTAARPPAVADFLKNLTPASGRAAPGRGRLVFALDATASREPTWDRACKLQAEMFRATVGIGTQPGGGLDLQLVYYRGLDECRPSPWLSSPPGLEHAMHQVRFATGETQIGQVLLHAIRETSIRKVGAVVFIGDACEEPLDRLSVHARELGRLGVSLFMFHEHDDEGGDYTEAGRAFAELADLSHGACFSFDSRSADRLRALLGAVAVYATGGVEALTAWGKHKGGEILRLTTRLQRGG